MRQLDPNIVKLLKSKELTNIYIAIELLKIKDLPEEEWVRYFKICPYFLVSYTERIYTLAKDLFAVLTTAGTFWLVYEGKLESFYPGVEFEDLNIKHKTWKEKTSKERIKKIKSFWRNTKDTLKQSIGNGMRKLKVK